MNGDRGHRSDMIGGLLLIGLLGLPAAAPANDYYSWIDSNGTMVMTDDPSRVPPPSSRIQVQVHRFQPVPPSPTIVEEPPPASREDSSRAARPEAMDPRDLSLPAILLGEPDQPVRAQYVWVPLLSPLFVGGNVVNGFWWHPGPISPVEAFKQFLAQHYREQRHAWVPGPGLSYPFSSPRTGLGPSGNTVFDQVVRERQALEESIRLRHFPSSSAPSQPASRSGGEHHSLKAR